MMLSVVFAGAVFASFVYIVLSVRMIEAPVSLVLLASVITGLGGGFTSCIMTCVSYVAQVRIYIYFIFIQDKSYCLKHILTLSKERIWLVQ